MKDSTSQNRKNGLNPMDPKSENPGESTPPLEVGGGRNTTNFYYNKDLKEKARKLRNDGTIAEATLWKFVLRASGLGYPFKRQRPIRNYIVDFVCLPLMLIIEVDGINHSYEEVHKKDEVRQKELEDLGFTVVRIPDEAILANIDRVRNYLLEVIKDLPLRRSDPNP